VTSATQIIPFVEALAETKGVPPRNVKMLLEFELETLAMAAFEIGNCGNESPTVTV
jgi:hypothetical protein